MSSDLGVADDPKLREALHQDEERVAKRLAAILDSKYQKEAVLLLDGDSAQNFLDVVQNALDRGFLIEQEHTSKARKILLQLSEACDKLPSSLFITGVTERDQEPTFGGGFGDIYRASYAGKTVALKHMRTFQRGADLRRLRSQFCREALVWQSLRHPHILPLTGIDRESFPMSFCMVSPWMEHGTVLKYLEDHGRRNVDKLLSEIALGLQYLHSCNVVHGDLRGANILITPEWSACLTDFGLTSLTDVTVATTTSHRAGTLRWMAPELLSPDRFGLQFRRTPASDVYAFGWVCLELYTGRPPFSYIAETVAMFKIIAGELPDRPHTMSETLWEYVTNYLGLFPQTRPDIDVVVENMAGIRVQLIQR
ncbi:kinase-like domain-containing protein [Mycena rebaudengoi]|nr:kinase-like domain-containing protein [Mycena rebaudengoi]